MNIIRRAIIWLLTKHETKTMVDHVLDIQGASAATTSLQAAPSFVQVTAQVEPPDAEEKQPSAFESLKASFAAKVQFIESSIAVLGSEAEAELVALAEKYL